MPRKRAVSTLKKVCEWLPDYFQMIQGSKMDEILSDIAMCEVESVIEARNLINGRIDNWVLWLNGTRPRPCPIEAMITAMEARGSA